MNKQQKFHHSVTENGHIQVRLLTEYTEGDEVISQKYGDPMTPADTSNMVGWDDVSKDIVAAITDEKVLADFTIEHQEPVGEGIEEVVTYDRTLDDLGRISIRRITRIYDDGIEVSKKYHRSWIAPGQDPSGADVMSKALAKKIHTSEVIAAYDAAITSESKALAKKIHTTVKV